MSNKYLYLFLVLALLPIRTLSQTHIEETLEKLAKKVQGVSQIELANLQKEVANTIVKELVNGLMERDDNDTCGSDWSSLNHLHQTEHMVGVKTVNVSRQVIAIDAFGKPDSGIARGSIKWLGNFDECLSVDTKYLNFSMQYCQLPIVILSVTHNPTNNQPIYTPILTFSEAVCLPTSCSTGDINSTLKYINEMLAIGGTNIAIYFAEFNVCTSQDGVPYTAGAVIMIIISFLFVLLSVAATLFDLVTQIFPSRESRRLSGVINEEQSSNEEKISENDSLLVTPKKPNRFMTFLQDVAKGFSLYKTVPAVFSTSQPPSAITSINGMRVISMFWVIMCHTYFFMFAMQSFANSFDVMSAFVSRFSSQPILNGFFSVDSFFFLSGLLVAYLTFRQMQRSKGRFPFLPFYIHRILRLTPTYMFVLFFYWFVTVHLGNGPVLNVAVGPSSIANRQCRDYWWTNLFYINNFVPAKFGEECMGWTWYLANDMQFYIITPLILIPLYYWLPIGLVTLGLLLLASFGVTGFIAGYYQYTANTFWPLISGVPLPHDLPDQSSEIYGKPYCRITPYLVGILLGYIFFKKYAIKVKKGALGWGIHLTIWLVAFVLGMVNVYGLHSTWHGHEFSAAENVMYFMFSRFTWGVTLFLVVYVCHNGYGGFINRFLSLPFWIPLSRLTFNAYLVHEIVMILMFSDFRTTIYYTDATFLFYIIGMVVLSYGAASLVTIFVEFPLSNLESAFFKLCGAPLRPTTRTVDREKISTTSQLEVTVEMNKNN